MKTPTNYGGFDLYAYLQANNEYAMADLYTFTLVGGFVARYTSAEGGLTVGGNFFEGDGIQIHRSRLRTVIGVEVDTLDLTIEAQSQHLLNGTPWLRAIRSGALDGADLKLERLFTPDFGSPQMGTLIEFSGRVADLEVGRTAAKVRVNSRLDVLNVQMPRNMYQPGCVNTLFDTACGVSKAAFAVGGSIQAGGTSSQLVTNLAQASGYFDLGTITFTSGTNAGVTRSIKQQKGGVLSLALPLVTPPEAGDTFIAYPGCNRSSDDPNGCPKFSNIANFRGFPFIPAPESVL